MPEEKDFGFFFKYQMLNFIIVYDEDDHLFLRICLPGIFDVDQNNRYDVLEACNAVNHEIKVAKCIIPEDDVWVVTEQLLDTTPDLDDVIPRSLNILTQARMLFLKKLAE